MAKTILNHKKHHLYCIVCGKKTYNLIDGRVCSDECLDTFARMQSAGFKGLEIFCNNCGKTFTAVQKKSRFCKPCFDLKPYCPCFYPATYRHTTHKRVPITSMQQDHLSIEQVARICKKEGITYGEYMRRHLSY